MKVIFDIDGTLADVREYVKAHLIEKKSWKTYFSHTLDFPPIVENIKLLEALYQEGNEIILLTGRPQSNRALTKEWLNTHLSIGSNDYKLLMWDSKLRQGWSTAQLKIRVLKEENPDLIIDDDPELCEEATKEGFKVLQVRGYRITDKDMIPED